MIEDEKNDHEEEDEEGKGRKRQGRRENDKISTLLKKQSFLVYIFDV